MTDNSSHLKSQGSLLSEIYCQREAITQNATILQNVTTKLDFKLLNASVLDLIES